MNSFTERALSTFRDWTKGIAAVPIHPVVDGAPLVCECPGCGVATTRIDGQPARKTQAGVRYMPYHRGLEGHPEQDQVRSWKDRLSPPRAPHDGGLPRLPRRSQFRQHSQQVARIATLTCIAARMARSASCARTPTAGRFRPRHQCTSGPISADWRARGGGLLLLPQGGDRGPVHPFRTVDGAHQLPREAFNQPPLPTIAHWGFLPIAAMPLIDG